MPQGGFSRDGLDVKDWLNVEQDLRRVFGAWIQTYSSRMMVEDVLQNTFLVAWRNFDPERGSLKNSCMKVGTNAIVSDARRVNVELKNQGQLWALEQESQEPLEIAATALLDEFPQQRWLLIKAIMRGNRTQARVLSTMYKHILDTDVRDSLGEVGWAHAPSIPRIYACRRGCATYGSQTSQPINSLYLCSPMSYVWNSWTPPSHWADAR